jgi:hypothetical protein
MATPKLKIEYHAPGKLTPAANNPRKHTDSQLEQLAESITTFGFAVPILVTDSLEIVAGHGCWGAAKRLGLKQIPCVKANGWSDASIAAYRIADNQLGMNSVWDFDVLLNEIGALSHAEFGLDVLGFDPTFLDQMVTALGDLDSPDELVTPEGLWKDVEDGMVDEQPAIYPVRTLKVYFATEEDVEDFGDRLGVELTGQTRTLWFPTNPNEHYTRDDHFVSDGTDDAEE